MIYAFFLLAGHSFFSLLWAENGSAPLQQVLGPANWERMGSGAAVPARAPAGAVPLTPAKPGEELLQPSCWEGWASGRQHFPNSANISSEREGGGLACGEVQLCSTSCGWRARRPSAVAEGCLDSWCPALWQMVWARGGCWAWLEC